MQYRSKRFVSLLLVMLMVVSMFPSTALASESDTLILGDGLVLGDNVTIITDSDPEPAAEEPAAEEPAAEEPVAEEPTAEEPAAEEPAAEEPVAEEPTAEEPAPVLETGEETAAYDGSGTVTTAEALKEALATTGTVTLGGDIELTEMLTIPQGVEITLDLASYSITAGYQANSTTKHIYALDNCGTLTIKDSVGGGQINARGIYNGYNSNSAVTTAKMTIESGIINGIDVNGGYAVGNYGEITINGGSFNVWEDDPSDAPTAGNYDATAFYNHTNATATLNGGTFTSTANFTYALQSAGMLTVPADSTLVVCGTHGALYVSGGTANVAGGTFTVTGVSGNTDNVVYATAGTLNITGGTFTGDADSGAGSTCIYNAGAATTVTGGSFSSSSGGDVLGDDNITIEGGTFENLTETSLVAVGSTITNGGTTYTMTANGLEETSTVTEVATYDDLVAALAAGGEIKLTADIRLDTAITVNDDTTIDLNDKTLTVAVENSYYHNATIKNGNIVLTKDDVHVCDGYFLVNAGKTLVIDGVTMTSAEGGIKGYAVFHLKTGANLDITNSTLNISNNEYTAGYIVYAGEATATLDVTGSTITGSNVNGVVHATTVIDDSTFTITDAVEHGINRSGVTINDSTVTISGGTGRGITAQHGDLVITGNSTVNITDMGEATIELRGDKNLTVAETATVTLDAAVNNTTSGTVTGDEYITVTPAVSGTLGSSLVNLSDPEETFLSAEISGLNATESVVIKLYSGDTQIATTTLKNTGYFTTSPLGVKIILTGNSSSWETVWTEGMPRADLVPDKMVLFVDGQEMNTAEVKMISTNGEAAVTWADVPGVNPVYVAAIGETKYETLAEAVAAANTGDTVMLLSDIALTATVRVEADDNITLDLNGKVIDGTGNCRIALMSYGTLTIQDSSEAQTGAIKAGIGTEGNTVNICGGSFTLESGTIYSVNNAILIDEEAATININGGTITAEPTTSNSAAMYISSTSNTVVNITGGEMVGYNGILLWNNTTINMTGGSIEAKGNVGIQGNGSKDNTEINISGDASVSGYYAAIYHPQGGKLTISENATLTGWTGVVVKGGDVTISGGTITGTGTADTYAPVSSGFVDTGDALYVEHYDSSTNSENYGTPTVTVTGGTFISTNGAAVASYANTNNTVEELTGFVSGGSFTGEKETSASVLEEGLAFTKTEDGSYTPRELPEAIVTRLPAQTLESGSYTLFGNNDLGSSAERPLNIVMNFKTEDSEEDAIAGGFGNWYTDFFLSISGVEEDFVATDCYLAGNYGDYGWWVIPIGNVDISNGVTYPVVSGYTQLRYQDICSSVKNFTAAIYITEEILEANPNLKVTLSLGLCETEEDIASANFTQVGESYTYDVDALKGNVASVTTADGATTKYQSLDEALAAAEDGDTITLLQDVERDEILSIEKAITLNGNGKTLTYTGTNRAIDMPSTADAQLNVSISNLTVDCTASYCQRGINYNDDGTLTLDNVTVKGTNLAYALNLPGSSDYATVNITNSSFTGCIALNAWGEHSTITATDSDFTSVDKNANEDYAAVKLNNDSVTSAEGTTITITGGSITALNENGKWSNAVSNSTGTGVINVSETTDVTGNITEQVAVIRYSNTDNTYGCHTLQDALAAAANDPKATVVLLKDITLDQMVTVNGTVVLDLNGKTISTGFTASSGNDMALCVAYGADLTINDSVGSGVINGSGVYGAVKMTNTGDNAENGTAKLTVNGGTLKGNYYAIAGNGGRHGTEITINGGIITATQETWGYGIFHPQDGTLTVTGGTIEAATGIEMRAGTLNVTGGTIQSTAAELTTGTSDSGTTVSGAAIAISQHNTNKPINVKVTGGTLKGPYALYQDRLVKNYSPSTSLTATIGADVSVEGAVEAAEEGYEIAETNGSYSLFQPVASITSGRYTYYYETLADAIEDAYPGETIVLLNDVTITERITVALDKKVTLDLNGHTILADGVNTAAFHILGDVTVTGDGTINAPGDVYLFVVGSRNKGAGSLTLENGRYLSGSCTIASVTLGTATINGGYFQATEYEGDYRYTFNCIDDLYKTGDAKIIVTGGTFYQFDPSDNAAEGKGTNFCDPYYTGKADKDGNYTVVELLPVAYIDETPYESLEEAIAAAEAGETVTLIDHVIIDQMINIEKAITLDLNDCAVTSTAQKAFEVYADVTIKNGSISAVQRCVDTRTAVTLNLENVRLVADEYSSDYRNPQPLTIGGSDDGTVVNLTNCQINAGATGYGIISFVETDLNITDSYVSGFGAVYMKAGSEASDITVVNSTLEGIDSTPEDDDTFAAVVFQTSDITLSIDAQSSINGGESIGLSMLLESDTGDTYYTGHKVYIRGDLTGATALQGWTADSTVQVIDNGDNVNYLEGEGYVIDADGYITGRAVAAIWRDPEPVRFASLQDAIAAAAEGEIVTLLDDITLDQMVTVTSGKDITLDLAGHTIDTGFTAASGNDSALCVAYGAALTIIDNVGTGVIDGTGVFSAVKMTTTGDDANNGTAKLTVDSGTLRGKYYGIAGNGSRHDTEIVINGGSISAVGGPTSLTGYPEGAHVGDGIFHPQEGTLIIFGGTISGPSGIEMRAGTLEVNGGTITATALVEEVLAIANGSGNTVYGAAVAISQHSTNKPTSATINGGTLTGAAALYEIDLQDEATDVTLAVNGGSFTGAVESENITGFITGGTYSTDVTDYCAEGYVAELDTETGLYGIAKEAVVTTGEAAIGSTVYPTLAEAIEAAEEGDFINILQNVETVPTIGKAVTIINNGDYKLGTAETTLAALEAAVAEGYTVTNVANLGTIFSIALSGEEGTVVAKIGDNTYTSVKAALEAAQSGETVVLVADSNEENSDMIIPKGVTLDLQAFDLKVRSLSGANESYLVGNAYHATNDYGTLVAETLILGETAPTRTASNTKYNLIPIWHPEKNCYVFTLYNLLTSGAEDRGLWIDEENEEITFKFAQSLTGIVRTSLINTGTSDNRIQVVVRVSWEDNGGTAYQDYVYNDTFVEKVAANTDIYRLTLSGYSTLGLNIDNMYVQAMVVTDSGVVAYGDKLYCNQCKIIF